MGGKRKGRYSNQEKKKRRKGDGKGARGDHEQDEEGDGGEHEDRDSKSEKKQGDWENSEPWELENARFESYYRSQKICSESEFLKVLEFFAEGLPAAIRINPTRLGFGALNTQLEELQRNCGGDSRREAYTPHRLSWYPRGLAWQWDGLQRRTIKKDKEHSHMKAYLLAREKSGVISRQEAVSMIPPLFLEVRPDHFVLDMCAAPGSKTSQIIEGMHWDQAAGNSQLPQGVVVANDVQWKRANMLAHQVQRVCSPCTTVINVDAQFLPQIYEPASEGGAPLLFDRVLCDVPCSGDGTLRKTPSIWKTWTHRDGLGLHIRQLSILYRGLDALKVGGRLVYSTCSLNPIEDEAVVAAALARYTLKRIRLLPPPSLEGLKSAEGLETWLVPHPGEVDTLYGTYQDVPQELKTAAKMKLLPSMFPPLSDADDSDEIKKQLKQCCRRFLPHLMNTGGFFVVAIEKIGEAPASARQARRHREREREPETTGNGDEGDAEGSAPPDALDAGMKVQEPGDDAAIPCSSKGKGEAKGKGKKDDKSFTLRKIASGYPSISEEPEEWSQIASFYGLDEALGKRLVQQSDKHSKLQLISEGLLRLLRSEARLATRFVQCGVTVMEKADSYFEGAPPWQLSQEGVNSMFSLGVKRRVLVSRSFIQRLLKSRELGLTELKTAAAEGNVKNLSAILPDGSSQFQAGSLVVALDGALPAFVIAAMATDTCLELVSTTTGAQISVLLEGLQERAEEILPAEVDGDPLQEVQQDDAQDDDDAMDNES